MLTLLLIIGGIYLCGKLLWLGVHAAWGVIKIVFIILAALALIVGLAYFGLLVVAVVLAALGSLCLMVSDLIL